MPGGGDDLILQEVYANMFEVVGECPHCHKRETIDKFWPFAFKNCSEYWLMGFHHSSFFAGQPVAAAGEIEVKDGVLKMISNSSGHYMPPKGLMLQVLLELRDRGYDLTKPEVTVEYFVAKDKPMGVDKVNQGYINKLIKDIWEGKRPPLNRPQAEQKSKLGHEREKKVSETYGFAIKYLKPDELKKYEILVDKGKLVTADKRPLDTTNGLIFGAGIAKGRFIYVMSADRKIYAADQLRSCMFKDGKIPDIILKAFEPKPPAPQAPPVNVVYVSSYYDYIQGK